MPDTPAQLSFDYGTLDTETAQFVLQQTSEIKGLFKQTVENILAIGQRLNEVKERLPHGQWLDWLKGEFDWTERTARNYRQVAQQFKSANFSELDIAASALYVLAAPSTSEEAREEALARAQAGERITVSSATDLRAKYTPSKLAPTPDLLAELNPPQSSPRLESPDPQPDARSQPLNSFVQTPSSSTESKAAPATPPKRKRARVEKALIVTPRKVQKGEWWNLGNGNYLHCGDPASEEFQKRLPKEISLSLASPPNQEAWPQSVFPNAISMASIFTPYQEDQDLSLLREIMERYIELYTEGGDVVALCFLPDPAVLPLIEQLDCHFFCVDPDPSRCDAALTVWSATGGKAEKMKAQRGGKKLLAQGVAR